MACPRRVPNDGFGRDAAEAPNATAAKAIAHAPLMRQNGPLDFSGGRVATARASKRLTWF